MNSVKRADESLAARTTNPDRNLGFRVVNAGRVVAHAASVIVIVEPDLDTENASERTNPMDASRSERTGSESSPSTSIENEVEEMGVIVVWNP
jgi:hypothetical protein